MANFMLFGGRGCGKDTLTEMLVNRIEGAEQLRLASFVVDACKAFGIDNPTRTQLTLVGQDIGRKYFGDDVWIKQAVKRVNENPDTTFIISDIRYQNEYDTFLELGFIPVLIDCEEDERIARVIKRDGSIDLNLLKHNTETTWKTFEWKVLIDNNGGIEALEAQASLLVERYKEE